MQRELRGGGDQPLGGVAGRAGLFGQVFGMIEQEAQRHRLGFRPGQSGAEGGLFPGREIDQIAKCTAANGRLEIRLARDF